MIKLGAQELRTTSARDDQKKELVRNPIYIILDNVLDTYNVGSIFRLADALAVEKVFLCGQTECPPNTRIKKASINTTEWVPWEYVENTAQAISNLRENVANIQIVAVEQDANSAKYDTAFYTFPIALIVGHESEGVSKDVLHMVDQIVEIPMWGVNKSLNVMVSLGIVLFEATRHLPKSNESIEY